jgi:hypothetical protein
MARGTSYLAYPRLAVDFIILSLPREGDNGQPISLIRNLQN